MYVYIYEERENMIVLLGLRGPHRGRRGEENVRK
jgi:hypothetical protein